MVTLLPLTAADAPSAARLHILGQPGTFLTRLGPRVLTLIYASLPDTRDGFGFSLMDTQDGQVLGYVAATLSVAGLFLDMATRGLADFVPALASQMAHEPSLIPLGVQSALYPLIMRDEKSPRRSAELLAIMVEPSRRSQGFGALLMAALQAECVRRAVEWLDVTVDAANDGARRFYTEHGFVERRSIRLNGRAMSVYTAALPRAHHG